MNQSPQKLGKGMLIVAFVMGLALLTLLFDSFLSSQRNPNHNITTETIGNTREVILQRNRHGHYVATGAINGHTVIFMLDTGATTISIPETVASRLNLKSGMPIQASTANGVITTYATRLDTVALGEISLDNVRANINPHMGGEEILLGMSFLKQLEFTQRGDTLILRQYL